MGLLLEGSKGGQNCQDWWKVKLSSCEMQVRIKLTKLSDYMAGKVVIDDYVTHERGFNEINHGFHDMHVSVPSVLFLSAEAQNSAPAGW